MLGGTAFMGSGVGLAPDVFRLKATNQANRRSLAM